MWVKALHTVRVGRTVLAWDARTEVQAAMESAANIKHGTRNGRRRSWRDSEGQAYCTKRIKERAQR